MSTQIIRATVLSVQVCTDDTDEEAENVANRQHPTGISSRWVRDTEYPGVPCADDPTRRHLILVC